MTVLSQLLSRVVPVTLGIALMIATLLMGNAGAQDSGSSVRPPANAVGNAAPATGPNTVNPDKPGNYDVEMWRKIRGGIEGQVSIPDKKAGVLVQSGGELWRNFRNGPLPTYGAYAMGGMIALAGAVLSHSRAHPD